MSHKQQAIWKTNTPADWTTELVMDDEQDWGMDDWEMDDGQDSEIVKRAIARIRRETEGQDDMDTIEICPCYLDPGGDEAAPVCQGVGLWVGNDYYAADPTITADQIGSLAPDQIGIPGVVLTGSDLALPGPPICAHWMADLEALAEAANDADGIAVPPRTRGGVSHIDTFGISF